MGNNSTYLIDDVYNPAYGKGGTLKSFTIGRYTNLNGYQTNERLNKYFLRKNLTGVQFSSAIVVIFLCLRILFTYLKNIASRTF